MLTLILAATVTTAGLEAQTRERAAIDHARRIFDLIRAEQFEAVTREFNTQVAAALSPAQMREVWSSLRTQFGAFTAMIDEQATTPTPGVTAVVLGCQFEKAALNVIVAFDAQDKIAGLRFTPRPAPAAAAPALPSSNRFREEAVTVGNGEWALPGTLSIPTGNIVASLAM